jgi:hypothetical protein
MNPARFDQFSKHVATRLSRRRAVRALGAAGLAGAVLSQHRQDAAADCPDATLTCSKPDKTNPGGYGSAGVYGMCWNWTTFACELCPGVSDAATRNCNATWPECQGQCVAIAMPRSGFKKPL